MVSEKKGINKKMALVMSNLLSDDVQQAFAEETAHVCR
jgi:hypothetical protein